MLSPRLRSLSGLIPAVVLAGLLAASPSLASQSLRITTPVGGTTVSGMFDVAGRASADTDVTISLAPQTFSECGATVHDLRATSDGDGDFATSIQSAVVADGVYCVIAVVGDGRLSTAVGDITVLNSSHDDLDGPQLPTESLPDEIEETVTDAALTPLADAAVLAPVVLGAAATLALVVLVFGQLQRTGRAPQ